MNPPAERDGGEAEDDHASRQEAPPAVPGDVSEREPERGSLRCRAAGEAAVLEREHALRPRDDAGVVGGQDEGDADALR